jgi:two-component system, chemotaxis family, protein-glutamate methylesterase/glutaminase
MSHDLVVVGTSWGGLQAVRALAERLPADLAAAVVVVQHRAPASNPATFIEIVGEASALQVVEATDKQPLRPGQVYVAPPDFHTLVEDDHLALSVDAPQDFSRPSIDVLFESAAEARRERCVGVVLTGANADGAAGLARIVELGGSAVVQDPAEAERSEMPVAALAAVPDAVVAPLEAIGDVLAGLCARSEVAA